MGYSVLVVHREVEAKFKRAMTDDFFEQIDNLIPLKSATLQRIVHRLKLSGFTEAKKDRHGRHFANRAWPAEALLTPRGLYLSGGGDGVFEISMLASELADQELAKYDPQENSWE